MALSKVKDAKYIVTTVSALASYTADTDIYTDSTFTLKSDSTMDISQMTEKLLYMGYTRVSSVEGVGQFSVRGSIVDIFSTGI